MSEYINLEIKNNNILMNINEYCMKYIRFNIKFP